MVRAARRFLPCFAFSLAAAALLSYLFAIRVRVSVSELHGGYVWQQRVELGDGEPKQLRNACFPEWTKRRLCTLLLLNDSASIQRAKADSQPSETAAGRSQQLNCSDLSDKRYIMNERLLSEEERSFPIAFQFLIYKDTGQFERLLRSLYRPHNFYCVHIDLRASEPVVTAAKKLVSCFDNVFEPKQRFAVDYGLISQTDAELSCMRELYKRSAKWKYLINLTGQEWPLKTMWQLVRILKALNGSNAMEGTIKHMNADRRQQLLPFAKKYNIVPVKGATHVVVVRAFVQYVLENPIAIKLHDWLKNANNPDETLFATLNHNPHLKVPGGFLGEAETDEKKYPFINRLKNWGQLTCNGFFRNGVCVWGVADLPFITKADRKELFVNKLFWDYQHWALDCLEEWYWSMTVDELERHWRGENVYFDVTYYSNLTIAKMHNP